MYVSNQVRQRRYLKGRRDEEENAINQQEVLDGLISKELGLDNTADYLNNVNKRIAERIKKEMAVKNFKDFTTEKLVDERGLMGQEDVDVGRLVSKYKSEPASEDQLRTQAEKQAALDLIALFQQDVKEGRKRQTAIDLANLNDEEDYRVRRNFMNVLDDMMDEIKDREQQKQLSKNKYNEQRMLLDKMMNLIENQRLHDSFIEFSNLASKNAYAGKIQRNFRAYLENQKIMKGVRIAGAREKVIKSQVGKTMNDLLAKVDYLADEEKDIKQIGKSMQQKMADLRARKAAKNSPISPTSTSVMSDAPESLDRRFGNNPNPKGQPKKSTTKSILDYETKREGKIGKKLDKGQQKRVNILWKKLNEELQNVD